MDMSEITEVETKISKSDFLADFKKAHQASGVDYFYFAIPANDTKLLNFAINYLFENGSSYGLMTVDRAFGTKGVKIVVPARCLQPINRLGSLTILKRMTVEIYARRRDLEKQLDKTVDSFQLGIMCALGWLAEHERLISFERADELHKKILNHFNEKSEAAA